MPAITATDISGTGVKTVTVVTLNGTDSLTYNPAKSPLLIMHNPTGSPISPTIVGDAAPSAFAVAKVGSVDLSAGFAVGSIAAGATALVELADISAYLDGSITITSGTGLEAQLLES